MPVTAVAQRHVSEAVTVSILGVPADSGVHQTKQMKKRRDKLLWLPGDQALPQCVLGEMPRILQQASGSYLQAEATC